jgi:hypothetical protein
MLEQIDLNTFLDVESLTAVQFTNPGDDDAAADLKFSSGGSEVLSGEAARNLYLYLRRNDGPSANAAEIETPTEPSPDSSDIEASDQTSPSTFVIDGDAAPVLGRNKAWFFQKDDKGRGFFLAFINAKGSCSVRTFNAETGIFMGKRYRSGNYQDQFADLIEGATELTVQTQPNLERDCKERLPKKILDYLRSQIKK